jgi:translation initiation factor IF-3
MPPTTDNTHRVNDQIRISPIRVVGPDGEMLGVIPTAEALKKASELAMDLVEVAPNERPPVCRIMDYGKFKYEQTKKKKDAQKTHQVQVKEIRLRPKTGDHDIEFKVKRARTFLSQRTKSKSMSFSGAAKTPTTTAVGKCWKKSSPNWKTWRRSKKPPAWKAGGK